jgi:hypothetical protein
MHGHFVETSHLRCDEQDARGSAVASLDVNEYWAYTPDGYVFVSSTRPAPHETVNSFVLTPAFDETCF